jgi:hypothetical protein
MAFHVSWGRILLPLCGCVGVACSSSSRDENTTFTAGSSQSDSQGSVGSESDTSGPDTSASASDGGTQTTTGETETTGTDMNCGEATFALESIPPNVMLVLDKSGSMLISWDQDGNGSPDGTRWNSLHTVVQFVTSSFDDTVNFGAVLFPSRDAEPVFGEEACLVNEAPEVPVAPTNSAAILAGIPGANSSQIFGATPATAGMVTAVAHLETLDPTVPRFIILVTDGAANCSEDADLSNCPSAGPGCQLMEVYDENFAEVVAAARDDGIPTFVVGIDIADELQGEGLDGAPEVNTFEALNEVAIAGGQPRDGDEKFYNTLNENELMSALEVIAAQVVSCTIPLNPAPENPGFVEIEIDGTLIPAVSDCDSEDGWVYVNPDGPYDAIQLCGAACETFGLVGTIDAIYACPPAG